MAFKAAAKKADVAELPPQPQVGDRIRLKAERINETVAAAKQVGWDFDPYAVRIVTREDPFNPGGGRRLWFDGVPHCFSSRDVILAWNTDGERREELRRRGWKV